MHDDEGTAQRAAVPGYTVAGKTGTAEVSKTLPDHAWFAGYGPPLDPRWVVVVFFERAGQHGGDFGAPLVRELLTSPAWRAASSLHGKSAEVVPR